MKIKPSSRSSIVTAIVLLALTAAGCGSSSTPTMPAPTPDSVSSIVDMSPVPGTTLTPGQTVTFTGTAGYTLNSAATAVLVLVIQDQANQSLQAPGTQPNAAVVKGAGQATLSQTLTLPATGITGVRLFFVLAPAGGTTTNSALTISYAVK